MFTSQYSFFSPRVIGGVSSATIAVLAFFPAIFQNPAFARDVTCQGILQATTVENVTVAQGKTCTLNGTIVQGNVIVNRGATLKAAGAKVNGNIQAEGAAFVDVYAQATVGGSIQVKQGRRVRVVDSQITGDIQFDANSGPAVASRNQVNGSIQAFQNTGGVTIRQNRVGGNLQCKDNVPAPIGGGNMVSGTKEDQCQRL